MDNRTSSQILNHAIIFQLFFIVTNCYGQVMTPTGVIDSRHTQKSEELVHQNQNVRDLETNDDNRIFSGQVPCNPNTFWVVRDNATIIMEYELNNSVISQTGIVYTSSPNLSCLAYANDNSGVAGISPTFFSIDYQGPPDLWVFNGSSWDTISSYPGLSFINCSGFGNDVYIGGYSGTVISLFHYANGNLNTVYTCPSGRLIMVADHAVDVNGNVYFFVGDGFTFSTDTLIVMSPSGNIIQSYPLSFNASNAYGCFIMGDTIYVGLGTGHPWYPGSLLPVVINQNTVSLGSPIPFPFPTVYEADLESCNPGLPVGLAAGIEVSEDLYIFPNPVQEHLTIKIPSLSGSQIDDVSLLSIHGKQIQPRYSHTDKNNIRLQFENITPGLYFVKIRSGNKLFYGKLEHIKN